MKIIDGKKISNLIKEEIKKEVDSILARGGKAPHLAAVIEGKMVQALLMLEVKFDLVSKLVLTQH